MAEREHHDEDIRIQRRLIEFVNQAHRPEDIARVTDVDEEWARKLLENRDALSPLGVHRFDELAEVVGKRVIGDWIELFGPRFYGRWTDLYDAPEEPPVHAALLRTGEVLFIPHGHFTHVPDTFLWDPEDADPATAFSYPDNQPDDNLYCSGHAFLSDGRLLVCGGGGASAANALDSAWIFDSVAGGNGVWNQTASDMNKPRWYPTVVTLGGRNVLVVGGHPDDDSVEIYHETHDNFHEITFPLGGARSFPPTYPGLHLLPGGEVFYTRTGFGSAGPGSDPGDPTSGTPFFRLTGSTSGEWIDIASTMSTPNRVKGMSALLLLGPIGGSYVTRVIVAGGNGTDSAEMADLSMLSPIWLPQTTVPGGGRSNCNVVLLPDGTVFVCGGASTGNTAVLPCALYDPISNNWSPMDSLSYRRAYHSVAVLLPSGQVAVTGDVNETIEVFDPPYMFAGAPPTIDAYPDVVHHASTFQVETREAANIDRVVLVRPMAVTHQTDSEQRVINLSFTRSGNTLIATAPDGNHPHPIAPRGYYLLFLVNDQGVPSKGKFLWLH